MLTFQMYLVVQFLIVSFLFLLYLENLSPSDFRCMTEATILQYFPGVLKHHPLQNFKETFKKATHFFLIREWFTNYSSIITVEILCKYIFKLILLLKELFLLGLKNGLFVFNSH